MNSRKGFALVMAVVLVALLVLLVVTLATLVRVETGVARNTAAATEARAAAQAGLQIALGRLQAAAGPDRRVTAGAGLLTVVATPSHPANRAWTGVWDSGRTHEAPLEWLVSGARPLDPSRPPPALGDGERDGVRLVGAGSTDVSVPGNEVVVAREPIVVPALPGMKSAAALARFAFWIGDEGVKGNLAVIDRVDEIPVPVSPTADDPLRSPEDRLRVRQLLAHRSGNDALNFPASPHGLQLAAEDDPASAERWQAFGRVLDDAQLRFQELPDSTAASRYRAFLRRDFHALTVHSRGLLVNTIAGGLRRNWSDLAVASSALRDLETIRPRTGGKLVPQGGVAPIGQPAAQVKPIVTELSLDFVPYRDAAATGAPSGRLLLGVRLRVELWNPFNLPLDSSPAGVPDYEIAFGGTRLASPYDTGLPEVEVRAPRQAVSRVGVLDWRVVLPADRWIPIDCVAPIPAGECVVVEAILAEAWNTGLAVEDANPADATDDQLEFVVGPDPMRRLAWQIRRATRDPGEGVLTAASGFPSPAFSRVSEAGWSVPGNRPWAAPSPLRDGGVSFHGRLESARRTWASWIESSASAGPPAPADPFANAIEFASGAWESVAPDPAASGRAVASQFDATELFAAGHVLRVRDAPAQRNLSLGALHFAAHPGEPALQLGQSWGGTRNDVFDEAFLLPVSVGWVSGERLPNPRAQPLVSELGVAPIAAELRAATAARHLAVAGMFNVNSTESDAWVVALGRAVPGWIDASGARRRLENPFLHFPHTAQEAQAPFLGRREFSDATLQTLATAIVARTRARGQPFGSLAEWINSGVLERAIDDAGLNRPPVCLADLGRVPARLEADFLTTATVLETHAPFLAVRSDTFRIRVCGEAFNPAADRVEARAYAEAVVQRFPTPVVKSAPIDADATGYGRKFEIVWFRWLANSDL